MNTEYTAFREWRDHCNFLGLDIVEREGLGEDNYDHFFAYAPNSPTLIGYFADGRQWLPSLGEVAVDKESAEQLGQDVLHPRMFGSSGTWIGSAQSCHFRTYNRSNEMNKPIDDSWPSDIWFIARREYPTPADSANWEAYISEFDRATPDDEQTEELIRDYLDAYTAQPWG